MFCHGKHALFTSPFLTATLACPPPRVGRITAPSTSPKQKLLSLIMLRVRGFAASGTGVGTDRPSGCCMPGRVLKSRAQSADPAWVSGFRAPQPLNPSLNSASIAIAGCRSRGTATPNPEPYYIYCSPGKAAVTHDLLQYQVVELAALLHDVEDWKYAGVRQQPSVKVRPPGLGQGKTPRPGASSKK